MIKGVIFDLDGTLYDYGANDVIAMENLCACVRERTGIERTEFMQAYDNAKKLIKARITKQAAQHNRVLFCQTALELLGANPLLHVPELYEAYWGCFLEHMVPWEGVVSMLEQLKAAGIKTAICTDMTAHIQYRKIRQLGLTDWIDCLVTSEEAGEEKPSPLMFRSALKKLNLQPEEAAYVGDSLERDVNGASACGIRAVWFVADRTVREDVPVPKLRSYQGNLWQEVILAN